MLSFRPLCIAICSSAANLACQYVSYLLLDLHDKISKLLSDTKLVLFFLAFLFLLMSFYLLGLFCVLLQVLLLKLLQVSIYLVNVKACYLAFALFCKLRQDALNNFNGFLSSILFQEMRDSVELKECCLDVSIFCSICKHFKWTVAIVSFFDINKSFVSVIHILIYDISRICFQLELF